VSRPPHIPLPDVPGIVCSRDEGEEDLWNALLESRFEGTYADVVRMELARLGLVQVSGFIRSGAIYRRTAEVDRPLRRDFLRSDSAIEGLANLIVAYALRLFQERALAGSGWHPERGASMAAYFVGTCLRVAARARRAWQPDYDPKQRTSELPDEVEAPAESMDEAEIRQLIWEWTGCTDEEISSILQMRVQQFTYKDIASALGKTPRAVEGRLARFLQSLRDRSQE
jgi:hypothetical protein